MATLYTQQSSNIRKTFLLMGVFGVMIVGLGFLFGQYYQNQLFVPIAVGVGVLINLVAYWFSDSIALASSGAQQLERSQSPELFRIIENLCITAGLPMPRVYLIPGFQINAFATGRDPKHSAVAVTEGALRKLNKVELEGVLAHEMSHVGNRDILVSTVAVVLAGVISMLADWFLRMSFFGGHRDDDREKSPIILVVGILAAVLAPIAATLIQLAVSRKREFLADASGALLTRYPEGLASALEKIANDEAELPNATSATAHMYLASPFKGDESQSWFVKLFMTHPPIEERIKILRGMDRGESGLK